MTCIGEIKLHPTRAVAPGTLSRGKAGMKMEETEHIVTHFGSNADYVAMVFKTKHIF